MRSLKRFCLEKSNKRRLIFFILILLLPLSIILSFLLGSVNISIKDIWNTLINGIQSESASRIFWYSRFPRTLACIISGASLATAGSIIQSVLSNKLASPGIIGVNAGAGLAVTLCCASGFLMGWVISLMSFIGAFAAVSIIMLVSVRINASRSTVILGGVAINSFLGAISQSVVILDSDITVLSADFNIGGFTAVTYDSIFYAGIISAVALLILFTLTNELDVIMLGEDIAVGLGMSVKKMRMIFLTLAALLAGASVSIAGLLGFVGLLVPHIMRSLVGNESRYLLPASVLCGASFVLLCDVLARCLFSPYEIPTGIIMSFIGAPFFIYLLLKKRSGSVT